MLARLAGAMALAYSRWSDVVLRAQRSGNQLVGGFASAVLSADELSRLTVRIYDRRATERDLERPLFAWEERWFSERLPAPPARVLVTAAGAGREAGALADRGFVIDALEPAPRAARLCRRRLAERGRVEVASHADLVEAVLAGADNAAVALVGNVYDAVVIGWASLSHVLASADRGRLLNACAKLAPKGPVLASFLPLDAAGPPSRAFALGRRAGGWLRRGEGGVELSAFSSAFGGVCRLSRADVEETAAAAGRRPLFEADPTFPHVTFLP